MQSYRLLIFYLNYKPNSEKNEQKERQNFSEIPRFSSIDLTRDDIHNLGYEIPSLNNSCRRSFVCAIKKSEYAAPSGL